jgi:hypothetical protein
MKIMNLNPVFGTIFCRQVAAGVREQNRTVEIGLRRPRRSIGSRRELTAVLRGHFPGAAAGTLWPARRMIATAPPPGD